MDFPRHTQRYLAHHQAQSDQKLCIYQMPDHNPESSYNAAPSLHHNTAQETHPRPGRHWPLVVNASPNPQLFAADRSFDLFC